MVYVSHRLPEILDARRSRHHPPRRRRPGHLRDRRRAYPEDDLIALMVGRSIEAEYPQTHADIDPATRRAVGDGLTARASAIVSFLVHRGEILGFAGAEGNGQREVMRALGGLERGDRPRLLRRQAASRSARRATRSPPACCSLSADRATESIFPALGVRENMTVQVLEDFAPPASSRRARSAARRRGSSTNLGIVTPTPRPADQRPVRREPAENGARPQLPPRRQGDPDRRADAGRRRQGPLRHLSRDPRQGRPKEGACIVNSSDALELAGICDRVLVFSRGRVIRELIGTEVTEENIVSSFLTSQETRAARASTAAAATAPDARSSTGFAALVGGGSNMVDSRSSSCSGSSLRGRRLRGARDRTSS